VHPLGSIAVAGYFEGTIDFGGGPLTSSVGHDLFVAKFDPNGTFLWSRQFATDRDPCPINDCQLDRIDLAVDAQGDFVLTGNFVGGVDFGGTSLAANGGTDIFVAKLASEDGSLLWSGNFGDESPQCAPPDCLVAATTDADDSVFLAGYFDAAVDFGVGPHVSAGDHDAFVVKMRP
jgi:hypothetical protein